VPVRFECPRCQTAFTREKVDDDEAFVECPSCGAMAMSTGDSRSADGDALARALSSSYDIPTSLQQVPSVSTEVDGGASSSGAHDPSDPFSGSTGAGVFSGLFAGQATEQHAAPPVVTREAATEAPTSDRAEVTNPGQRAPSAADLDLGLDDEFGGDFIVPSSGAARAAPRPAAPRPPPREAATLPPGLRDAPADPSASALVGSALDDDAFGALEAAFNDMTERPTASRGELSDDERAFLSGAPRRDPWVEESRSAGPPRRPPPRPSSTPARPPPRRAKPPPRRPAPAPATDRARVLTLSPEAREAAFLPLKNDAASAATTRAAGLAPPAAPERVLDEQAERDAASKAKGARRAARERELGIARPPRPAPRPAPTVLGGLSVLALAGVVLLGVVVGGGIGAGLALRDQGRRQAPLTTRARAEQQFVEGNRAYDSAVQLASRGDAASSSAAQARFSDAVGHYKAAISIDRTYALAHRAKGAALAKQQRWDEAAAAYRDYLAIERDAIDGADVREALARRGLPAADGGAGGG
jgi:hypothetical protein